MNVFNYTGRRDMKPSDRWTWRMIFWGIVLSWTWVQLCTPWHRWGTGQRWLVFLSVDRPLSGAGSQVILRTKWTRVTAVRSSELQTASIETFIVNQVKSSLELATYVFLCVLDSHGQTFQCLPVTRLPNVFTINGIVQHYFQFIRRSDVIQKIFGKFLALVT